MRLLLDTHVVIDLLGGVGPRRRAWSAVMDDPGNIVRVSVVSLWEMALKSRIGKLDADLFEVEDVLRQAGFELMPIAVGHLRTLRDLPVVDGHRDPFDHLLIAQAIAEDLVFLTADRHAARYPVRLLAGQA